MSFSALFDHKLYQKSSKICLLCNQTSYDFGKKRYLFDLIADEGKLHCLLLPEHGLFSEIQDQENVDDVRYRGVQCYSLYNKRMKVTGAEKYMAQGCDLVVIDIFDVGVRYYTYSTHMFGLLRMLDTYYAGMPVMIIDRINPAGTRIEGTIIQEEYTSFLGASGMIHRHGMSTGQLCRWHIKSNKLSINIHDVTFDTKYFQFIMPSPNLPSSESLMVYPGQCFWEATTLSEGRGTTRPFEIFGHPDLTVEKAEQISQMFNQKFLKLAFLRPIKFIPVYHKHKDKTCTGWQLSIQNHLKYHCIFGTLTLMRWVNEMMGYGAFWRQGPYEFDSNATAAQLLIGDDDLIAYVNGIMEEEEVKKKLHKSEEDWRNGLLS